MNINKFFDRKPYLDILEKRVFGLKDGYRQNIALIGDEMVGKTSVIFKFLDSFYDSRFIMLYLETRTETLDAFIKRFIGTLLYNFLANSGTALKEDVDYLIQKSSKYCPKTCEKINQILSAAAKRKRIGMFTELFSLPELIHQETGKFCVVILDEFHNLEGLGFINLYREWSKLLISQKNTIYIIISSMKFKTKTILSKNLSLLFGNFEVITVEPFGIKTSEQYLENKLRGNDLTPGLKNFLVHFTGGYPFYLEVITDALIKSEHQNLTDTLEGLLFEASGILNQRFSIYTKRFTDTTKGNEHLSILYLISNGRNKIKDIAHILRKHIKEVDLRISQLLEFDTISRSADFLKINDRVFSFWLKFVSQEKLRSLTFNADSQKKKFRDMIEEMIQEFLQNAQKPVLDRITELMRLFENEVVQLERKKFRLSHFREIKPLEFNSKGLRSGLIGRSNDTVWLMAIKDGVLTEDDISDFSKECKKYRNKLQKKIVISLSDINTNTLLKAMEEKIWTWDLNNLNQILDLYSKPRVIA